LTAVLNWKEAVNDLAREWIGVANLFSLSSTKGMTSKVSIFAGRN
jgi:hypothetical protein